MEISSQHTQAEERARASERDSLGCLALRGSPELPPRRQTVMRVAVYAAVLWRSARGASYPVSDRLLSLRCLRAASTAALLSSVLAPPSRVRADSLVSATLEGRARGVEADDLRLGMQASDVFYPPYFEGTWETRSNFTSVFAPLGEVLFGGPKFFEKIKSDLNSELVYSTRFSRVGDKLVSDRLFNVRDISRASMGPETAVGLVEGSSADTANKMVLDISPPSGPPLRVTLTGSAQTPHGRKPICFAHRYRFENCDVFLARLCSLN